jgi:hypothetical protein
MVSPQQIFDALFDRPIRCFAPIDYGRYIARDIDQGNSWCSGFRIPDFFGASRRVFGAWRRQIFRRFAPTGQLPTKESSALRAGNLSTLRADRTIRRFAPMR